MRHDYSTEQFQAFRGEVRESFWGQVRWRTQHLLQQLLEADSEQQMAAYLGLARYERSEEPQDKIKDLQIVRTVVSASPVFHA